MNLHYIKFVPAGEAPAPQLEVVKAWTLDEIKATRTGTGWGSDKDWGEGVKGFKFNKVGGFTLDYTAVAAQNVKLQLLIAVKYSNRALTGFYWQEPENGHAKVDEKTAIFFNGTEAANKLAQPATDIDFSGVTESTVSDNGNLSVPEWFDIAELGLLAQANTITVNYVAGGCSYYVCGARIVK